ncbi:MAG: MGH1-like glycoside hydrolase domain-containing protein [Ignavibacteriaceae bacterium]
MIAEDARLLEIKKGNSLWRKWGPYLTDRQWGTVREDYSSNGDAWNYVSHDDARSKAYRWGEEGIGGISDQQQILCFALSFWNGKDPILKERYFGLTGKEGNHGEDVKEYFYYLDNIPTHSYMKMLYKYPQSEFPYAKLIQENLKRGKLDPEYELIDTGIFDEDKYFDIFVEYAKADPENILIKISVFNRANETAELNVIPQAWFRNTWAWGYDNYKPVIKPNKENNLLLNHQNLGDHFLYFEENPELLFCDNDTNIRRLYNVDAAGGFFKDGINDYIVNKNKDTVNNSAGTKTGINYLLKLPPFGSKTLRLRLNKSEMNNPFNDFDSIFNSKIKEADEFYEELEARVKSQDEKNVQRQALAGMLWCKQFYYYDIRHWLKGDPAQPAPPPERFSGRNNEWTHLNNADIISMPDKWEYPWYASWDLAFHCIPFALIDPEFAKHQLKLLTREWFMHPNGQLPAYEWNFSDVNPPVHAWATWRVYKIDQKKNNGQGDIPFLESVFHKLLLNFTWWVNRKDEDNRNIFQGGFLGLDNIGVFDRSSSLPAGGHLEEADATSWMAMYSLNLLRISLELAKHNPVYQDVATKFLEHFLFIAGAMTDIAGEGIDLWDDEDEFFYDVLHTSDDKYVRLKVRSMVGLIPLFAVEVMEAEIMTTCPEFAARLDWFLNYRPDLANLVSRWREEGMGETRLFSLLRGHRLKRILKRMLDETEFLSDYGIRALSKYHENNPYVFFAGGNVFSVNYEPAESQSGLFGGNSNWRGPIWFPVNFLIVESLQRFHHYYGDDFKVEYPTNSKQYFTLNEIANEITKRLSKIFLKDENGNRPVYGDNKKLQSDPNFKDYILFHEYFNGDNGKGLGASHQTGWTGLIAKLLQPRD